MKVTHCPNCQTCFKVTDEQLKLYNGKVRCGRCAFVFNALNHLIEVEDMSAQTLHMPPNAVRQEKAEKPADKPVETAPAPAPAPAPAEAEPEASTATTESAETSATDTAATEIEQPAAPEAGNTAAEDALDTNPFIPRAALQEALTGDPDGLNLAAALGNNAEAEATQEEEPFAEEIEIKAPDDGSNFAQTALDDSSPQAASTDTTAATAKPFYVEPELELEVCPPHELEEEPPQRPSRVFKPIADLTAPEPVLMEAEDRLRPLWLAGAAVAALLLALQLVYINRTQLTVSFPGLKPALVALCGGIGCSIPLPADDTLISIESSELNPDANQPNLIRLSATLLNRADFDQALPMLELTLTDTNDQTVVRKVFEPSSYLDKSHPASAMLAKSELQANLALDIGDLKAAGYRLFLFYPK
jgi:predicted Zn finger-like uncharacterized protein